MQTTSIDRRDLVKAAGIAATACGLVAAGTALADEAKLADSAEAAQPADAAKSDESQAGAGVDWPGTPADPASFDIAQTYECEVLVCGLGAGGCTATLACAQKGLDVVAIEKSVACGSIKSYLGVINSRPQNEAGLTFDQARIAKELVRYASGYANQKLVNTYLSESADLIDWIEESFKDDGVTCYAETDVADGWHDIYELWPMQVGYRIDYDDETKAYLDSIDDPQVRKMMEPGLATYVVKHAEELGATLLYDTPLVQLVQDADGRVTSAIAHSDDDDTYVQVNASKGVILATGGYEADPDLLARLNPSGALLGGVEMAQPGCVGDGIRAGLWAGGIQDTNATLMTFERAALPVGADTGYPYQGTSCWIGGQPFLKVNTRGERICNETSPCDWPLHAATLEPGHKFCSIWDADYQDSIKTFHTLGCSRIDLSPDNPDVEGLGFEALDAQIAAAADNGAVMQADTIEELAEKLQMDPDTLAATVERYNELAAKGVDEDFGKPAKDLIALENPPFYGCFFGGHVLCTLDGLQITEHGQVIRGSDQQPIEGLYATGNCSGSMYSVTYPELLWGNANARTCTLALHIVKRLAQGE